MPTPPTQPAPTSILKPTPTNAPDPVAQIPQSVGPKTVATLSADLEVDSKGHEHLHATLRDHTGVHQIDQVDGVDALGLTGAIDETGTRKTREKELERQRRKKEREALAAEPLYRKLGDSLPPPKSERCAVSGHSRVRS